MFYHWLAPLGKTSHHFQSLQLHQLPRGGRDGDRAAARVRGRARRSSGGCARARWGRSSAPKGPASHQSKRGTPTMGGLIILLATIVPTLLWAPLTNRFVIVAMLSILWMGVHRVPRRLPQDRAGQVARAGGQVEAGGAGELRGRCWGCSWPTIRWCPPTPSPPPATTLPFFKYLVVNFAPLAVRGLRDGRDHRQQQRREPHRRARRAGDRPGRRSPRPRSPSSPTCSAGSTRPATSTSSTCRARASWRSSARALMGATHRLPLVQRPSGAGLHGRHRQPRDRRRARHGRHPAQGRVPAAA